VLFLDLDRFKVVNDSLGHAAGDAVLVAVARRLESVLRAGDTAARFGGDEFVILCDNTTPEQAGAVADRIASALASPITVGSTDLVISASVGVAVADHGTHTASELLRDADAAMYSAKDLGRARFEVFDRALGVRAVARLQLEQELREGIGAGQLRLHYQPEVRLADRVVVGVEALVRWEHPTLGLLAPDRFLPLAEQTQLIRPLGDWVTAQAIREAASWTGPKPPTMWVNLSPHQLGDKDLTARIADQLSAAGLAPGRIGFELVESALLDETDGSHDTIHALHELGVGLALDDFGTGFSSLTYLARFPIDTVKIDRSFVSELDNEENSRESYAIVSAVVGLAQALELSVVGEGIETETQAQALRGLGCRIGQGFLLGRPTLATPA